MHTKLNKVEQTEGGKQDEFDTFKELRQKKRVGRGKPYGRWRQE